MSNDWKKVSGGASSEIWKYEKAGDELSGIYVENHTIANKMVPGTETTVYTFEKADGTQVAVFGKAGLDRWMQKIPFGHEVRIVYQGKQKNDKTGFSFHAFDVFSRKPSTAPTNDNEAEEVNPDDIPF